MINLNKKDVIENLVGLFVIVAVILGGVYFLDFENVQQQIQAAGIWAPILLILAKASTLIFAPLSGSPLYPVAGALFGFWPGVTYIIIGDILGSSISFWISRKFGQAVVERMLAKKNMPTANKVIQTIESTKGFVFTRICFAAMPEIVAYGAGLTKISFKKFILIYNVIGLIPTAILVGSGGILVSYHDPKVIFGILILGTIAVAVGAWLFWKYTKNIETKNN